MKGVGFIMKDHPRVWGRKRKILSVMLSFHALDPDYRWGVIELAQVMGKRPSWAATLYPALASLEEAGIIDGELEPERLQGRRARRFYALTEEGARYAWTVFSDTPYPE